MTSIQISPSILAADFSILGEEIKAIEPFSDMIHLDVMDGHFVPNLTFGPPIMAKLRPRTTLPFDVHLMISPVDFFLETFVKAGADILTVHPEAEVNIFQTLQKIKRLGAKAGVALHPGTSVEVLKPLVPVADLVMVMTVNPGFEGQKFLENQLEKIRAVRNLIDESERKILLEVDGGITPQTAPLVIEAGADILVAATAIFKDGPLQYEKNIKALRGNNDEKTFI